MTAGKPEMIQQTRRGDSLWQINPDNMTSALINLANDQISDLLNCIDLTLHESHAEKFLNNNNKSVNFQNFLFGPPE